MAKGLPVEEHDTSGNEELSPHLLWIWDTFCKLSRRRLTNQTGPQPITSADLDAQCRIAGVNTPDDIEDLEFFIDELDIVWLRHTHQRIATEREKARRKAERR